MTTPTPTRCKVHLLNAEDLERAVDDPGLAALLASGWTVGAHQQVELRGGRRCLALILAPPVPVAPLELRARLALGVQALVPWAALLAALAALWLGPLTALWLGAS